MRKVAIVGVGMTKFSGKQNKTAVELFTEAATDAISESNIKPKDLQALFLGNCLSDFAEGQMHIQAFCAESIGAAGIPANRYENACASASAAVRDAFISVAGGFYDLVIAGGTETAAKMGTPLATRTFAMASDGRYEFSAGITFPGVFALLSHLYSRKYGVPIDKLKQQMAQVSVNSHYYGARNPKAQFQKEITIDDVLKSFMVATPIQLQDCCPFTDGAAAVVLASEKVAKKLTSKPVYIAGVGQASAGNLLTQKDYLPRIRSRELAAKQSYDMSGLKPKDIDVIELHDCFSIATLIALESLGFFEYGKSGEAVEKGETRIGGKIPVNVSGGLKSKGHPIGATGAAQVYEIVKQIRGECGERQVEGAKTGMTDCLGGDGGTLCNIILKRGW
ncbi:MAG: thiolase domain-containing protein [Dehalococcoidia bacterium]|nr:thiolase domain-containing protein [Dehalococcoidia bacterium]MDD5495452.1 thiolase domain-containing protein [Dehalococcoidia bacterium]